MPIRNPYKKTFYKRTPNKVIPDKKVYKQTKIVKFYKTEDEIFLENNIWNKIKEEVEFQRYKDKQKMKELGMISNNGEYNYDAYLKWKETKDSWVNLSMEDDDD